MPLARAFDGALLEHFTVVHWDQRGAGKSYGPTIAGAQLTRENIVDDGIDVVRAVRVHFPDASIVLVGHSWGTIVATEMARRARSEIAGLVLVGTVADVAASDRMKLVFLRANVRDDAGRALLDSVAPPPFLTYESALAVSQLAMKHGGPQRFHEGWIV